MYQKSRTYWKDDFHWKYRTYKLIRNSAKHCSSCIAIRMWKKYDISRIFKSKTKNQQVFNFDGSHLQVLPVVTGFFRSYLHGATHLIKKVYIKPKHGIVLQSDQLLGLLKPLCGLLNSEDCCHEPMVPHLKINPGMTSPTRSFACFVKMVNVNLTVAVGTDVDDATTTENTHFQKESSLTECTFEYKSEGYDSFVFPGIQFEGRGENFQLYHATYASKL